MGLLVLVLVLVSKAAQGKTKVMRQSLGVAHDHMGFGCLIISLAGLSLPNPTLNNNAVEHTKSKHNGN